jgi:NadR type nicotinamide-nucleotide adenylyltransferase
MESDRLIKIGILGAESSGKTTLAEQLAEHYHTVWVPEFARRHFETGDIAAHSIEDLEQIAHSQMEEENELRPFANGLLFCDTTLITIRIWSILEFGEVPPEIDRMIQQENYDHYLVLDNSVAWVADALRLNKFDREMILSMNIRDVLKSGRSYTVIRGTSRLDQAIASIDQLLTAKPK